MKEKLINLKEYLLDDQQSEFKRFMIVVLVLFVISFVVFLFTKYVINDGDINIAVLQPVDGAVNYNVASVGTMLSKSDDEYYAYLYSSESLNESNYKVLASKYVSQESKDKLHIYYVDLEKEVNKDFLVNKDNKENTEAKEIDEMHFGEVTLLKIKNGEVVKYLNTYELIEKELAVSK